MSNLLEQTLGQEPFAQLVAHAGGTDYEVPERLDCPRGQELAEWIGDTAAAKLIDYAGGDTVYVKACHNDALRARYVDILRLRRKGLTPAQIARSYTFQARYTERQIWAIVAGNPKEAAKALENGDLFADMP